MVLAISAFYLYFGIRGILQVWIPRGSITIKKCRVALGVLWLPLETIIYLTEIINYMIYWSPSPWAMPPPMSIEYFLVWIIFLVTDTLYQFHTISKIQKSNTQ